MLATISIVPYAIVLSGVFAVTALGLLVKPFIDHIREEIEIPAIGPPDSERQQKWKVLTEKKDRSGYWVGLLERLVFLGALLLPPKDAAPAIGVWLAFKLAAKWEAWNHMGYVPEKVHQVHPLDWAYARRIWAAHGYGTLVLGTGANFTIAVVVAGAVRLALLLIACPSWFG